MIGSVSKSDQGEYQCKAENVAGARETPSVTLGVHQPPYFISKPEAESVALVGGDLVLQCRAGGDPQPRISWSRAAQPVSSQQLRSASVQSCLFSLFCFLNLFVDVAQCSPALPPPSDLIVCPQDAARRGPRPGEPPPQPGGRLPVPGGEQDRQHHRPGQADSEGEAGVDCDPGDQASGEPSGINLQLSVSPSGQSLPA